MSTNLIVLALLLLLCGGIIAGVVTEYRRIRRYDRILDEMDAEARRRWPDRPVPPRWP